MMALSMKTYLALLWGISVLYAVESDMSASNTETSSMSSTAEPHKPAEIRAAETTEAATATYRGDSANNTTSDLVAITTVAATTSRTEPRLLHASTAVITTAGAAHPSHSAMISETTANPTGDQIHQQSPTTSTAMAAPATASVATVAVSSQQPSSTAKPEVTSKLSPITSPETFPAPVFNQTFSGPSASATTTMTASHTSETATVFDPTTSETFTTSTALLSTSKLVSVTKTPNSTSQFPDTAGLSSTAESPTISFSTESPISTPNVSTAKASTPNVSTAKVPTPSVSTPNVSTTNVSPTNVSTTNVSTSPTGILIPRAPKKLPVPTTKSTPVTTTAPCEVSKSPSSSEVQPCSTRRLVKHCLIAVASLAALATVFMISTIILCIKLSSRKYKVKKTQPATEMMCISALLPERNITYSRQRNPVTNGVLVIHGDADSDEDGGDNLTLSSFLPENDRYV
ncbi:P-selectin glycoprotein ligand 1 [Anarrhichthys ocellatus]|uniref:P-selectin glycoprotein ligand 1 n=1 Tax=Anarrhichthys ocellatus TaxID=433405 RepID=UPI0012ED6F5E|nr:mucin-5AC-like [Anarrhichthys ocellatus]